MEAIVSTTGETLGALKDVTGVEGSFYATRDGTIVARDMPRIYDGDSFDGMAVRIGRMLEALAELGGTNEGTLIRHPHHALFVRPTEHGFLGILATADVNVPSLKRAASLVSRRLPPPGPVAGAADTFVRTDVGPSGDFTPVPSGLPPEPRGVPLLTQPPLPDAVMTFRSALPPTTGRAVESRTPHERPSSPGSAPRALPTERSSTPGSIARPLPTSRASVPGAPASGAAVRWRGTNLKD